MIGRPRELAQTQDPRSPGVKVVENPQRRAPRCHSRNPSHDQSPSAPGTRSCGNNWWQQINQAGLPRTLTASATTQQRFLEKSYNHMSYGPTRPKHNAHGLQASGEGQGEPSHQGTGDQQCASDNRNRQEQHHLHGPANYRAHFLLKQAHQQRGLQQRRRIGKMPHPAPLGAPSTAPPTRNPQAADAK